MRNSIELNAFQLTLLCFAFAEIGAVTGLLVTRNVTLTAGLLQIIAMVFVSISVLLGARKKETREKQ